MSNQPQRPQQRPAGQQRPPQRGQRPQPDRKTAPDAGGAAAISPLRVVGRVFGLVGKTIVTFMMVGIITGCIVACVLTVYILRYIGADVKIDLDQVRLGYTSIMYAYDADGEEVELKRLYYGGEDRIWIDYEDINEYTKKAIVAIEDKRFWDHDGVDWRRTIGAAVNMFIPLSDTTAGGGSTITQQLIKNITGDDEYRVERKVQEIFRALDLAKRYSREEILEAYLNLLPLGNGTNGIQAAANLYFNKDAKDLTLAESAALVGITQYPGYYDPFTNPENNKNRQLWVLKEMLEQELITQEEHDKAVSEPLNFKREKRDQRTDYTQSWFVDHVINEVLDDLQTVKGLSYSDAAEQLYSGGFRIYTTVDMDMQEYLEEFYLTADNFPPVYNEEYPQSACVIIDPGGKMLAVVGAIGEKTGARTFNPATMSRRHPGSAIKPIGAYVLGIETGRITWSTIIEDSPVTGEPDGWSPSNYYGGHMGNITVCTALQRSVNTVAVKVVQMLTPRRVFDFLTNELEFTGLVEYTEDGMTDVALSPMSLGALTYGVSPLEMAGAYQIFVNGGKFTSPYSYTHILDASGTVVLEKDTMPKTVVGEDTAVVMNKLLQTVITGTWGTGAHANLGIMPTAGKTGTSQDDVNQWFVGMSPYYIAPVWLGYERTTRVQVDSSGRRYTVPNTIRYGTYPPPIAWRSIMLPLHEDLEYTQFMESDQVVSRIYCTISGDLATASCSSTASGWYKASRVPGNCTGHAVEAPPDDATPGGGDGGGDSGGGDDTGGGDSGTDISRPPSIFDGLDLPN